jgi:hypothetical protein
MMEECSEMKLERRTEARPCNFLVAILDILIFILRTTEYS